MVSPPYASSCGRLDDPIGRRSVAEDNREKRRRGKKRESFTIINDPNLVKNVLYNATAKLTLGQYLHLKGFSPV